MRLLWYCVMLSARSMTWNATTVVIPAMRTPARVTTSSVAVMRPMPQRRNRVTAGPSMKLSSTASAIGMNTSRRK